MSMSYYSDEGLGFLVTKELILECAKEISNKILKNDVKEEDFKNFEESFHIDFYELFAVIQKRLGKHINLFNIQISELLANEMVSDYLEEVLEWFNDQGNLKHIDVENNNVTVYPFKEDSDNFKWLEPMRERDYYIYNVDYRIGLFTKPFESKEELVEKLRQAFPALPKNFDVVSNMVYYTSTYYG